MEERRGLRKGAIVSSSRQGMTSWSKYFGFFQAYRKKKRCHCVKQYAKICAIGSLYLRRTKN